MDKKAGGVKGYACGQGVTKDTLKEHVSELQEKIDDCLTKSKKLTVKLSGVDRKVFGLG